jgi:hypothetical protein
MPENRTSSRSAASARRAAALIAAALLLALSGTVLAVVEGAAAVTCTATMTVSGPSHGNLTVTPGSTSVRLGACVEFDNSSPAKVTLTVTETGGKTDSRTIQQRGSTTVTPASLGKASVDVTEPILLGIGGTAHGSATVTVKPAPAGTSSSPTPTGKHTTPGTKPDVAPKPKKSKHGSNGKHGKNGKHTPKPHATGIKLPPLPPLPTAGFTTLPKASNPVVAPGPPTSAPITDTSTPVAAVIGGPIEPGTNNTRGLPEAVGVLVVLGLVTGWGRVLLATTAPVDSRPEGEHRA